MKLLISVEGGAQQDRIVGGSYTVSQKLEKKLKHSIAFNQVASSIEQKSDHVVVTTSSGASFKGKYVIMAHAPLLTNRIRYNPPLPTIREEFATKMPLGKVIKCLVFYKDNFWRKKGFSGEFVSEKDILNMGFEATLQDDSHPALVGFICGQHARYWSDKTQEVRNINTNIHCVFFQLTEKKIEGKKKSSFRIFLQIFWRRSFTPYSLHGS